MTKTNYIERVNGFIVPYLGKNGYSLIKTEFVEEDNNRYLRLYIDLSEEELADRKAKLEADRRAAEADEEAAGTTEPSDSSDAACDTAEQSGGDDEQEVPGVSINDCVKVSRYLSKWLDKEDFIKEVYTMEVCSRGFLNDAQTSAEEE